MYFIINKLILSYQIGLSLRINGNPQQPVTFGSSPVDFATTTSSFHIFHLQKDDVVEFNVQTKESLVASQTRTFLGSLLFED